MVGASRGAVTGCISSPSVLHPIAQNGQEGRMRLSLSRLLRLGPNLVVSPTNCTGLRLVSALVSGLAAGHLKGQLGLRNLRVRPCKDLVH